MRTGSESCARARPRWSGLRPTGTTSRVPSRSLFNDIRVFFPIKSQLRVLTVVERHVKLAIGYVDEHARAGVTFDGSPLRCHATTRKGTACQRVPLPSSKYCPSHQHLEEDFEAHGGRRRLS